MTTTDHNTKACKHCSTEFEFKRKTAEFCKESCKKMYKVRRQRNLKKKRLYRAETSAFFYYLADECRRAETVEVLRNHTMESLQELHSVYKYRLRANNYGKETKYSLCHLFPVNHPHKVGALRADNLVVSYSHQNSKHGNTAVAGVGVSISRLSLTQKWKVSDTESKAKVISLIVEYLSQDFVEQLAVKLKLQSTVRQQVFDFLTASSDPRIPIHAKLEEMSTQELSQLKALISGKESSSFGAYADHQGYGEVFGHELRRLSQYRPELQQSIQAWEEQLQGYIEIELTRNYGKLHKSLNAKTDIVLNAIYAEQFNLLHGSPVQEFLDKLPALIAEARAIQSETVPYEATLSVSALADWKEQQRRAKIKQHPANPEPIAIVEKSSAIAGDIFLAGLDDPSPIDEMVFPEYIPPRMGAYIHDYDAALPF